MFDYFPDSDQKGASFPKAFCQMYGYFPHHIDIYPWVLHILAVLGIIVVDVTPGVSLFVQKFDIRSSFHMFSA